MWNFKIIILGTLFEKLSDVNKIILKSSFWILVGTILSKSLLLFSSIIIVKFVDKSIFGQFGIIKSTVNMFTVFAGLGLGLTATKYIAQYKDIDYTKISRIIGLSNFFSILLCLFIAFIFIVFSNSLSLQLNAPNLSNSLKISAFILFFSGLNGIQEGILCGFEKFKAIAINSIIAAVISNILQIIGAKYYGLNAIIIGFGLNFFVLYILNLYSIRRIIKGKYTFKIFRKENFNEINLIWKFSIPAVLSGLMVSPVIWLTNNFLVNGANGFQEMADFDIANQWRATVLFIPGALSQVALPMLSSAKNSGNFKTILNKNIILNFFIALIVVIILIIMLPVVLNFYGNAYKSAKFPLIIMLITTVLVAVNNIIGNAIAGLDKMWLGFFTNSLWALVLIVFSYYLITIRELGSVGLAAAYLISYVSHSIIQYIVYKILIK